MADVRQVARIAQARRERELVTGLRTMGTFGFPADYTIAGNARVSIARTKSGRQSRSRVAEALRKYTR